MNAELHFLVVNDEPNMRRLLVALLKEIGYMKVSEAENGEMALRAFKAAKTVGAPIEFVITDCAMPHMNGLNLIRTIRHDPETSHVPILMFTSQASKENILTAVDAGADDYIVRPFNATSLRKKLEKILAKRNLAIVDFPGNGLFDRIRRH
jgi:two-component system chemotaxis response regulator CheY